MPNDSEQIITMLDHPILNIHWPIIFTPNSASFSNNALAYNTIDIG
jgi:hypothetical protein